MSGRSKSVARAYGTEADLRTPAYNPEPCPKGQKGAIILRRNSDVWHASQRLLRARWGLCFNALGDAC